jgi:hypothetical protein
MIRTFHTSADDRDFKAMTSGKGSLGRNLLLISLPVAFFVLAAVYLIWRSAIAGIVVALVAFGASAWSNVRFFSNVRRRKSISSDGQAVVVTEVQASRVLDLEPLGSHGPVFVFFADNGKALLLVGQWMLNVRSFPCASFRLYQWAETKEPIRIEPLSRRLKPEESTVQLRSTYRRSDVEVFDATPETLQRDLDKAFEKKMV